MLKKGMSSLDIKFCLEELEEKIIDSWVGKIYDIEGIFLLKLNPPEKSKKELIIEPGKRIHLTTMKHHTPQHPPSFPMLLRKHLTNSKLTEIRQPDLERIVELKFEKNGEEKILIAELFGNGNLILCDENRKIIKPYKRKAWKHRKLEPNQKYELPPKKWKDISSISKSDLKEVLSDSQDLVRGLAKNLNIGGPIAEEICERANFDKKINPGELNSSDYETLYSTIQEILSSKLSPNIVYENEKPVDVLPFLFEIKSDKKIENFESFNKALDHYFQKILKRKTGAKSESRLEKKLEEVNSRLESQKKHLQELHENTRTSKKRADAISTHHEKIDTALQKLDEIRESEGWEEIDENIQEAADSGEEWAAMIKSVQPKEGTVVMRLPEETVELDLRKSSFENASELYEKHKKSKNKIEGAEKAIKETEQKLKKIKEEGLEAPQKPVVEKTREKKWYERYRWFFSSDEFLVIAGRDAKTNQEVVEKHMQPQDQYLHADLKGAPHTVIKSEGEEIPENTIEEAAKFAAIHSRAWREKLASIDVYWVDPEQVSKEAPAGEYLPTGSYMIKGERNYQTVPIKAGVGLIERNGLNVPMCGPSSAVSAHSDILIELKPGKTKKSDLAHKIKTELEKETEKEIDLDELMGILPPGPGMVVS